MIGIEKRAFTTLVLRGERVEYCLLIYGPICNARQMLHFLVFFVDAEVYVSAVCVGEGGIRLIEVQWDLRFRESELCVKALFQFI